jgi:Anti-sigma-K factor rskA
MSNDVNADDDMTPAEHDHIRSLLGPCALNALDGPEHLLVSTHIETCAVCQDEVTELLDTSSLVALSVDQAPPERIWSNLQTAMGTTEPKVIDLVSEHSRRRPKRRAFVMALTAAAAVVLVTVPLTRSFQQKQPTLSNLAANAAKATGSRTVDLVSVDATKQKIGDVVLTPDGQGYVRLANIPPLPDDQTYQLWAIIDGKPISEGLLGSAPTIAAFNTGAKVQAIALSVEKSTGATAPTIGPIAVASL